MQCTFCNTEFTMGFNKYLQKNLHRIQYFLHEIIKFVLLESFN